MLSWFVTLKFLKIILFSLSESIITVSNYHLQFIHSLFVKMRQNKCQLPYTVKLVYC